jgi:hypothetical protein
MQKLYISGNDFKIKSYSKHDYHILTFAATGFTMLNIYGDHRYGLDIDVIEKFSDKVNKIDEPDSLYPIADISAVPIKYVRDLNDSEALAGQIIDFLKANSSKIKKDKVIFDFRAGVTEFVMEAIEKALESEYAANLEEVIIINDNNQS